MQLFLQTFFISNLLIKPFSLTQTRREYSVKHDMPTSFTMNRNITLDSFQNSIMQPLFMEMNEIAVNNHHAIFNSPFARSDKLTYYCFPDRPPVPTKPNRIIIKPSTYQM